MVRWGMQPVTSDAGLCASCRHARSVASARGSQFLLCARSKDDPRFPKYPPLPVIRCIGYEHGDGDAAAAESDGLE